MRKAAKKRFRYKREAEMMQTRPILNRQETQKKINKNLDIAKRKMEQILNGSGQQ